MAISVPVTKLDESEASQKTAPKSSLGFPYLFIGVCFKIDCFRFGVMKFFLFHSVGKNPGLIALTLTP